jgi:amidase
MVDPKCVPIPWRKVELPKKLKITVLWHDDIFMPTPPVRRALESIVADLKHVGHDVIEWRSEGHAQAAKLLVGLPFLSSGRY